MRPSRPDLRLGGQKKSETATGARLDPSDPPTLAGPPASITTHIPDLGCPRRSTQRGRGASRHRCPTVPLSLTRHTAHPVEELL
jgi:hypothetical protein